MPRLPVRSLCGTCVPYTGRDKFLAILWDCLWLEEHPPITLPTMTHSHIHCFET